MTAAALSCTGFRCPWGGIIGVALIGCTEYQTQTPDDVVAEQPTPQSERAGPAPAAHLVKAPPPVPDPGNVDEFLLTPNQIAEANARAATEQQRSASAGAAAAADGADGLSDGEGSDGSVGPERDGSAADGGDRGGSPTVTAAPSERQPPTAGAVAQPAYPPTVRGAFEWFRADHRRESDEIRERALARGVEPLQGPYPDPQQQANEVAFAFCIVTLTAQGYSLQVRSLSDFAFGPYLECVGANYSSDWQAHMRLVLEDWGAASAFRTVPPAIWERCVDAMMRAPRARVRRGEAFGQYCVPAMARAWRRRR